MDNKQLPPMPPSDAGSLEKNYYDHFYQRSSRSFWKNNEVNYINDKPFSKCEHYFMQKATDFICNKCNFGLMGGVGLKAMDGKLFYKNEQIMF